MKRIEDTRVADGDDALKRLPDCRVDPRPLPRCPRGSRDVLWAEEARATRERGLR
jgi:hypothetical protein